MTTLQAFNTLLRNFLHELTQTFPEDSTLAVSLDGLDTLAKMNARKPLEIFMEAIGAHAQLLLTKDPALFATPLELPGNLDLKTYWDSPGLSQASRDAIWQYLQQLYLLGSTVSALPPDMLTAIEGMAQECAGKIERGEADLGSITNMLLSGGLGNLMGGPGSAEGLGALGNLLGSGEGSGPGLEGLASMFGGESAGGLASLLGGAGGGDPSDDLNDLLSTISAPPSSSRRPTHAKPRSNKSGHKPAHKPAPKSTQRSSQKSKK
jgi:hypothetical protein